MTGKNFQIENRVPAGHFLETLARHNPEFFFLADYFLKVEHDTGRFFLNYLGQEAHDIETILDNAEVFTNELFLFREVVSGIRWFSSAAVTLDEGVLGRYARRNVKDSPEEKEILLSGARRTLETLYRAIHNLCRQAVEMASGHGIQPPRKSAVTDYIKFEGRMLLEKNRVPVPVKTPLDAVEIVASEFLSVRDLFRAYHESIIRRHKPLNEKDVNQVLSGLHTLQSFYDSHLHETALESEDEDFWSLRGYISVSLRLVQLVASLSHFYERHILSGRDEATRRKLSELIEEDKILAVTREFGISRSAHYIEQGAELALVLLTRCTGRSRRVIRIPVGIDGIHARPMTWIHLASQKHGRVVFEIGGEKFDADSMLSLLMMAEAIDRVIGLEDKESQISVSAGTIINELESRHKPIFVRGKILRPATLIGALESFRDEYRTRAGTRFIDATVTGPLAALEDIEEMASNFFRQELLSERLGYIFEK